MLRRRKKLFGGARFNPLVYSPALWLDASDASTLIMDGARTFNGSSQAFTKAHNSTHPDASGDFWISAFIYLNATDASYRSAITKADTTTLADWIVSKNNVNQMYFTVDYDSTDTPATGVTVTSTVTMSATTWCHVFVYYDYSSGVIGISVNGESFVTATKARVLGVNSKTLNMGANANGGFNFWNGKLDSVAFGKPTSGWLASNATALRDYLYNSGSGRRSSDFISSAYYTGGNPSGAVSWWDMDARSGNETDRIGSNNLTDNGGVGYAAGVASGLVQYTGDPVKQWSDKSGNARHATATSDSTRPSYATGVQNGLSAILYDALDDKLDLASPLTLTDQTIFAVVKLASTVTAATSAKALLNVVSGDACGITYGTGTGTLTNERLWWYRVYLANVYGKGQCAADIPAGGYVHSFSYTNAAPLAEIWQNGVAQTLVATSAGEANSTRPYTGYQRIGSAFGDHICELLIFPSVLSTSQRQQVERYLGNKWGITVP